MKEISDGIYWSGGVIDELTIKGAICKTLYHDPEFKHVTQHQHLYDLTTLMAACMYGHLRMGRTLIALVPNDPKFDTLTAPIPALPTAPIARDLLQQYS